MKMEKKLSLLGRTSHKEPAQAAALCVRRKAGKLEVFLITSRDTGRWVLPKGWMMANKSPAETALTESWEEAGVIGQVKNTPIGHYSYDKVLSPGQAHLCHVDVFVVKVDRLAARFPEKGQRRRKWMRVNKAAKAVAEPQLAELLRRLPKLKNLP